MFKEDRTVVPVVLRQLTGDMKDSSYLSPIAMRQGGIAEVWYGFPSN